MKMRNTSPKMDGHDGANAQEEPFDLSQRLTTLSVNDFQVIHIEDKKGDNI